MKTQNFVILPPGATDPNVRWSPLEYEAAGAELRFLGSLETAGWYTVSELAGFGLPGIAGTSRHVRDTARRERWQSAVDSSGRRLARRGPNGQWQYHPMVLPLATQAFVAAGERGEEFHAALSRTRPDGEEEFHWTLFPSTASKELVVRHARREGLT